MTRLPTSIPFRRQSPPSGRRLLRATPIGLIFLVSVVLLGIVVPQPTAAVQETGASPVATQTGVTPIATPERTADTRCSVVLGTGDEGDACVAFVQAIPGLEPVDLTLGDGAEAAATGVAFGEYVDFVTVPGDGEAPVRITDSASPDLVIADEALELQPDVAFVLVLEQAFDGDGPTLTAVPMDLAPLGPEESRLAFHHAVTDAAQLSVLGLASPSDAEIAPGETTDPITVEAGMFAVDVVPGNEPDDVLATLDFQLEPGLSYVIIVAGRTGDQTVQVIYAAAPVASEG